MLQVPGEVTWGSPWPPLWTLSFRTRASAVAAQQRLESDSSLGPLYGGPRCLFKCCNEASPLANALPRPISPPPPGPSHQGGLHPGASSAPVLLARRSSQTVVTAPRSQGGGRGETTGCLSRPSDCSWPCCSCTACSAQAEHERLVPCSALGLWQRCPARRN